MRCTAAARASEVAGSTRPEADVRPALLRQMRMATSASGTLQHFLALLTDLPECPLISTIINRAPGRLRRPTRGPGTFWRPARRSTRDRVGDPVGDSP